MSSVRNILRTSITVYISGKDHPARQQMLVNAQGRSVVGSIGWAGGCITPSDTTVDLEP